MSNLSTNGNSAVSGEGVSVVSVSRSENEPSVGAEIQPTEMGHFDMQAPVMVVGKPSAPFGPSIANAPLGDFLQRPVRILTSTFTSADTPLALKTTFNPWSLFLANADVAAKTENFKYIRGTLNLMTVTTTAGGAYGAYCLSAVPNGGTTTSAYAISATQPVETALQTSHVWLDIGEATKGHIQLPFMCKDDYMLVSSPEDMWKMNLWCFDPVKNGQGTVALNVTCTIWAWCGPDVELVVPYQQGGKKKDFVKARLDSTRDTINDKVKSFTGGAKASEFAGTVAKYAGMASTVPFLAPLAGPIAGVAGAASSFLDMLGFTRESKPSVPTAVVLRPFSNLANVDGQDTSEIAGLFATNSISFDPVLSRAPDGIDQLDFEFLFSKWTLVHTTTWSTSTPQDAQLAVLYVSPFFCRDANGTLKFRLTPAGYVGLPFSYWRGGMEYMIVIPSSKFHRGTLQIAWMPSGTTLSAGDLSNVLFNDVIDLAAGVDHTYQVNYASNYPCMSNNIITSYGTPAIVPDTYHNGRLILKVMNPLSAQTETSTLAIYIFARAMPDMSFGVIRDTDTYYRNAADTPQTIPCGYTYEVQGGAVGDEDPEVVPHVLVPPPSAPYPLVEILWGEKIASCRAMMQKFSQSFFMSELMTRVPYMGAVRHAPVPPSPNQYASQVWPYSGNANMPAFREFTFDGWYAALFTGIASSRRYKITNTMQDISSNPWLAVGAAPMTNLYTSPMSWMNSSATPLVPKGPAISPTWPVKPGESVEICVPYAGYKRYELVRDIPNMSGGLQDGERVDCLFFGANVVSAIADSAKLVVHTALGPDIRVNTFRFVPIVGYTDLDAVDNVTQDLWGAPILVTP